MKYIEKLIEIEREVVNDKEKCFCIVRKSFIPLTPEEKVRQSFLKYLIDVKQFPIDRIKVEESLAHYDKGNRRIDILVLDSNDVPLFIYECKREFEPFTDEVIFQAMDYFNKLETVQYVGVVIGNNLELLKYIDESKDFKKVEQPSLEMFNSGSDILIEQNEIKYKRNKWKEPIDKTKVKELINYGIIGEGTDKKYHSFLLNLDGWLLDEDNSIEELDNVKDIGIKFTKFGNVGGVGYDKEYRSFLIENKADKPIVSIALTSMQTGKNSPTRTSIIVGVETVNYKNSALQIQIEKSLNIVGNKATVIHNGTITVGKLGASKRQDLIDFVQNRNPDLIKNNNVFLGAFDTTKEINSSNIKGFIKNVIDYSLIRNEFRTIKKDNSKLQNKNERLIY